MARAMLAAVLVALAATSALAAVDRQLLSSGVTCTKQIPFCTAGRCTLRIINDKDTYVCLRCMPTFVASKQGGDILQCVCPPGTVQGVVGGVKKCVDCDVGSYCPGGNLKAVAASDNVEGHSVSCNPDDPVTHLPTTGLTTLSSRATKATDCVATGGYVLPRTKGAAAVECAGSSYAPNNNRLKSCLSCQVGLSAPPGLSGPRISKSDVCQVPPGSFWEGTVARECPQGLWRASYLKTDQKAAAKCKNCPGGWGTQSKATTALSDCSVLQPGYKLASETAGVEPAPGVVTLGAGFIPLATELCDVGFYYDGTPGIYSCVQCPYGTPTQAAGATSIDDCMVPPGYYIDTTANSGAGAMAKCPDSGGVDGVAGYYRTGWVSYNLVLDATGGITKCTACGTGIPSEAVEEDENPLAAADSVVAATSASCYIPIGWGMTFDPTDFTKFKAAICPLDTYGVAAVTYGLFNSPCKTCAKGLTTATQGSSAITDCKNKGGFGYATEGSSQCPDDSFAVASSMTPCNKCPDGRRTPYIPGDGTAQDAATDCLIPAGYGVYSASAADPFNPPAPTETMVAKPCPIGYAQNSADAASLRANTAGTTANPKCQACAGFTSTSAVGSATCDACKAGYGGSPCALCPYGQFSDGASATCSSCPSTTFQSDFGLDITSVGLTVRQGLAGAESCVPEFSQLADNAGTRLALPDGMFEPSLALSEAAGSAVTNQTFVQNCIAQCPHDKCCVAEAVTDDTGARSCRVAVLTPVSIAAAVPKLFYKLPPSDTAAASLVEKQDVSSGIFAACDLSSNAADLLAGLIGTSLDPSKVETPDWIEWGECTDLADCEAKCSANSACYGFVSHPDPLGTGLKFALRTGESAIGHRTFFGIPDGAQLATLSTLGW